MLIRIAWHSLWSRRMTVALAVLLVAVCSFTVLGVIHLKEEVRSSFSKTISGTDLIVGARTGPINLLLYSVFHTGNATSNLRWSTFEELQAMPGIAWAVPIALGDSHRGYRVTGTTADYFRHFRYGNQHALDFAAGHPFTTVDEVVLGAEVANKLGYKLGDSLIIAHGIGEVSFSRHDRFPLKVSGILAPTGTPVDRTLLVSLASLELIHRGGSAQASAGMDPERIRPSTITAAFVGLESRAMTFVLQRQINASTTEPLLAILPGVVLAELWDMLASLERILALITLLVALSALLGVAIMLLAALVQREREIAVLRVMGARPLFIFMMIELEALLMAAGGVLLGSALLEVALQIGSQWLAAEYGIFRQGSLVSLTSLGVAAAIILGAMLLALLPAGMSYWRSLHVTLEQKS